MMELWKMIPHNIFTETSVIAAVIGAIVGSVIGGAFSLSSAQIKWGSNLGNGNTRLELLAQGVAFYSAETSVQEKTEIVRAKDNKDNIKATNQRIQMYYDRIQTLKWVLEECKYEKDNITNTKSI